MNPISLMLNLLLAVLLVLALGLGWRLQRQLKKLRDSHAGFADAVGDLDRAARRAEVGLAALRTATDEALELLVGRIDKARELAAKLEQLSVQSLAVIERARPVAPQPSAPERKWSKPVGDNRPADDSLELRLSDRAAQRRPAADPHIDPEAAAEAAIENLVLKLSREDGSLAKPAPRIDGRVEGRLDARLAARAEARAVPRSRAPIDDDLFDAPAAAVRAAPGGRY